MTWWARVRGFFRTPTATFDSTPRPIADLLWEMAGRGDSPHVGRAEALSVPAVLKGRNMLCSIATLPLVQHGPDRSVVANPLFEQLDPDVANVVTLAQTVEDLLFEGIAWWRITAFGWDGYPVSVRRLDPGSVSLHPPTDRTPAPLPSGLDPRDAVVWVDGLPVSAREMIRFDSPNPALLKVGGRAIRRAILLDKAAAMYADDPRPLDYFTPADGADPIDDDEVEGILAKWKAARKKRSTAYVPAALKYNSVATPSPSELQLAELQQRAALDIANELGVDPEDLGVSTTSRTYQNATDRRQDRINEVLSPYMRAITDRLSMGDVTKRGYRVVFDLDDYMKADPITRWTVYEKARALGVLDSDGIAETEGLPAPSAGVSDVTPEPVPVDASRPAALTFDNPGLRFADIPVTGFSVDLDERTIEGLALPYGRDKVGRKFGLKFRFNKGALQWGDVGRVKLLREHGQAIGRAVKLTDTAAGLQVKFKVARGEAGDEALLLAEDGVLDGLSVGVDFDMAADTTPDPRDKSVTLVRRADLREVSLTAMPAFDDARVTKVAASLTEGETMSDATPEPTTAPAAPAVVPAQTFNAEQVAQMFAALQATQTPATGENSPVQPDPEPRQVVNPTRLSASVSEPVPYRFDRGRNFLPTEHVFSADLLAMSRASDLDGTGTDAGRRVMGLLRATFATATTDVDELNPTIQRPDMYVDQRDHRTPLWDFVNKGAPPNGVQPFSFPKFDASTNLVGDHAEGVEPTAGAFTTTGQTVTPSALSGKAEIRREVWDMGGNPAVSTLIYSQMVRGYREGLETATATFLNTLTAATDITIATAATDETLAAAWDAALAELQFVRGYDFEALALEKVLYKAFVAARDTAGRVLYPIVAPQNANGTAQTRFRTLDLGGVTGVPSWALPSVAGSANNSWLFDPSTVHGWASAPQRLEFQYQVKNVEIAIWGYKAFANSDIAGVRQVIYDSTT